MFCVFFTIMAVAAIVLGGGWVVARVHMGGLCTAPAAPAPSNARQLSFFAGLGPVLNIAHRGASAHAPEHSLAAYELALQQGADVLELDLRLTRDHILLVTHDRTMARALGELGSRASRRDERAWSDLTFAEVAEHAASRTPLTLDAVLGRFPRARFNLELKDESLEGAHALAALLARHGAGERVLVASWHREVLEAFRKLTSGAVATSASGGEALEYFICYVMERACPAPYSALQLPALQLLGLTSERFIARAHEQGLDVHFWTVDEPERMRALVARGADGIMTNHPDRLARVLGERR